MPDQDQLREDLRAARHLLHEAQDSLTRQRQSTLKLEASLAGARRSRSETAKDISRRLDESRRDEAGLRDEVKRREEALAGATGAYWKGVDPTKAIERWSSQFPVLLFPVRLEARFRAAIPPAGRNELWVRIYPDDCCIDSFEDALSETEIKSAERYWLEWWQAAGDEPQRRSAWRNLVASHGTGRATWILDKYKPVHPEHEPVRAAAADLVLVVRGARPAAQAKRDALRDYWVAAWRAAGKSAPLDAARQALDDSGFGPPGDVPINFAITPTAPATRDTVPVTLAWLELPDPAPLAVRARSWTSAPTARALPDEFVIVGFQGGKAIFSERGKTVPARLTVGVDPGAPADQQLHHDASGELVVPEPMRWMVDFDAAVDVGLGVRISLDRDEYDPAKPIERLLALGIRHADDPEQACATLEELITHHRFGRAGFAFVPQGSPTNNTDGDSTAYSRGEDADAAYDANRQAAAAAAPPADWWERSDGRWLADMLGIDARVFDGVPNATRHDFSEARALNRALWPATFGYTLETMMHPVFTAEQVAMTRWFFSRFVSGRGLLPAVRIDDQPYGVLPIMPLSRMRFGEEPARDTLSEVAPPDGFGPFIAGLAALLGKMRKDWTGFSERVARIGGTGDPHQMLLDIVGLHPASVEMHQRYAESLDHIFNRAKYSGIAQRIAEQVRALQSSALALALLRNLGYDGAPAPDALDRFFFARANRLNGPIIDDRPLSETEPIRPYAADGVRNYLAWLADAAVTSFEDLRLERGFANDQAPDALLYVMLRHALMLEYWDTSLRLFAGADILDVDARADARREPAFVHVAAQDRASESPYRFLYAKDARITQDPDLRVVDHIRASIGGPRAAELTEQLAAVRSLAGLPTARLERCLAEHIDLASHRLDAWLLGLVNYRFAALRYGRAPRAPERPAHVARGGVYLGAFGLLEDLRARNSTSAAFTPPKRFDGLFPPRKRVPEDGPAPLLRDRTNGGHIFAPSINQATTAAVLRAGYLANATRDAASPLALNLSSRRVRAALQLVEGIRNGQPLGALLGYQFQRGLHDGHAPLELDRFIHPLRKAFPLVADQMASTRSGTGDPIEALEANNVLDGLKLIEHVRKSGSTSYPFGLPRPAEGARPADPPMPTATAPERAALDVEVDRLLDAHDALADLALAEGVHQAVLGNYDGVAATMDAFSKGAFPPEPQVVRTPRSGLALTHRVGVHFKTGVDPAATPAAGLTMSPRASAQPMVNLWLTKILPPADHVACVVRWVDPATGVAHEDTVTQMALDLQPIDLLHVTTPDGAAAMGELDDRLVAYILKTHSPRSDVVLDIRHTERLAKPLKTFFELAPLLRSLRTVLLGSRPLVPTDLAIANEAGRTQNAGQALDRAIVEDIRDRLKQLRDDAAALAPAAPVDKAIDDIVPVFERASRFGIQQVGWGALYDWRRQVFAGVLARVQIVIDRWQDRLTQFQAGLVAYDGRAAAGASDTELFLELGRLELLVAASTTSPRPATPAAYRAALPARRDAMAAKRNDLLAIVTTSDLRVAKLVGDLELTLPLEAFDLTPFAIDDFERGLAACIEDLRGRLAALLKEIDKRLGAVKKALDAHAATAEPLARVTALQKAGSALLGDDVKLIPEITFSADRAAELAAAHAASVNGDLTRHLQTSGVEFPVDDFLAGVARVREKMRAWENTAVLAATLGRNEPGLTPMQLPYRENEGWLALQIDPATTIDSSRLLYTAHIADGAATPGALPDGRTCGLLIDEWSEVIPSRDETAGVAVHFDRPNSEPPQTWLLAATPGTDGRWRWQDLIDSIDEAMKLAQLRAVEPAQVETSAYAPFLPATVSAATLYGVSISANFARVNAFATELRTLDG